MGGGFELADDWTPWTISVVVIMLSITNKVAARMRMLKLYDGFSCDLRALGHEVLGRRVNALDNPVVPFVALAIVTITRHFVLSRKWRWNIVGVQVAAGLRMFKSDDLFARDRLAGRAELVLLGGLKLGVF